MAARSKLGAANIEVRFVMELFGLFPFPCLVQSWFGLCGVVLLVLCGPCIRVEMLYCSWTIDVVSNLDDIHTHSPEALKTAVGQRNE